MTSSSSSPLEGSANVVLTCVPKTTDNITGYEWYKDNTKITVNATKNNYSLPDNKRANSGSYQCKVATTNVQLSPLSYVKNVTFLCKISLLLFY